jgi:hypothetical protein
MASASTAHGKIVALLITMAEFTASTVYDTHEKANLSLLSVSVEVETDTPLDGDAAINMQELVDNRNVLLSIRVHTGYRLGMVRTTPTAILADAVIRKVRENINLGNGYRVFDVPGVAYNVEHSSSGTTGAQINVNIHKVEFYE